MNKCGICGDEISDSQIHLCSTGIVGMDKYKGYTIYIKEGSGSFAGHFYSIYAKDGTALWGSQFYSGKLAKTAAMHAAQKAIDKVTIR